MTYSFKKTLKKVWLTTVEILIAGIIALEAQQPELMLLVPLFEGFRNWLKHKNN